MRYFVKTPWWLKQLYPRRVWNMPRNEKVLYLTFDDGPHPVITPFVLDLLKQYNAQASFFFIGKNVQSHPDVYARVVAAGHAVGNHTQQHSNGWHTPDDAYLADIAEAGRHINSCLFRPPYGRMRSSQARRLEKHMPTPNAKIIMWDVLSGDFDTSLSPHACARYIMRHARNGSIIVLHDSEKALPRLEYALPEVLRYFTERGFVFRKIDA